MYEENMDFDEEFDEESDEAFYEMLREAEAEALEKGIVSITDTEKVKMANGVFEVFKRLFADRKDVNFYIKDAAPFLSGMPRFMYVYVEGKDLLFSKTKWFAQAMMLADNYEVIAKLDGTVSIDLGFKVEEVYIGS